MPEIDPVQFRKVMGQFATGVTVVTTLGGGKVHGMTANAFMSGSLEPPLCVISVAKRARMHKHLGASGRFVVNVLAHDQAHLAVHFSGRADPRLRVEMGWIDGLPMLSGALAHLAADVVDTQACGDHTLFIGQLFFLDAARARTPLLYHESRFASLVHRKDDDQVPAPEFW
jgi:flavin reductase (DIM6/NTAB) family NADH-FMN oxidoreductase RutF